MSRPSSARTAVVARVSEDVCEVVIWPWYDVLVLGQDGADVRLWEPAHGEMIGRPCQPEQALQAGARAYASSGLPGAEWWAAGSVGPDPVVDLDEVLALYDEYDVWGSALA